MSDSYSSGSGDKAGWTGPTSDASAPKDWATVASDGTRPTVVSDTYTEVTTRSWTGRLFGAVIGAVFGLVLLPLAAWGVYWNEGRAVRTARSLTEGAGLVRTVPAERVDPANEGRLVYVAGPLTVPGAVTDGEFGVRVPGAAQLRRQVEMYQWREETRSETRSKLGGGQETVTTYTYNRGWADHAVDSSHFRQSGGHQNPPMRYASTTVVAPSAQLGGFQVTEPLLRQLGGGQALPAEAMPQRPGATVQGNTMFLGASPAAPQVGDVRITWQVVRADAASVIAQQSGGGFAPYQTRAGNPLNMMVAGTVPAETMIHDAEAENALWTWVLRAVGVLVIFLAFVLLLAPFSVAADLVPLFGSIVGAGVVLVALLLTMIVAPLVIAVAWVVVRPLVGIAVLAVGAVLAVLLGRVVRARRLRRQAAAAPSPFFQGAPLPARR